MKYVLHTDGYSIKERTGVCLLKLRLQVCEFASKTLKAIRGLGKEGLHLGFTLVKTGFKLAQILKDRKSPCPKPLCKLF
jgi:hypothetical protein